MRDEPRLLEAIPIQRIVRPSTGETVGWIYQWNTGELAPLWLAEEYDDVVYKPFPESDPKDSE